MDVNERRGEQLRSHLYGLTRRLLDHVAEHGAATLNTDGTPIIELPIAPTRDLINVSDVLWRHGLFVTLAPYPGVPRDKVGFRIQVTAAHTSEQVDALLAVLSELAADSTLRVGAP
jgi:8-amino-7-oxononanoate synthase